MRKLSKKLVAACMTAAMMLTMVPAAFAAEPTATTEGLTQVDGVYQIEDGADLVAFAALVNGGDTDANAILLADIDLTGTENYIPMGTYNDPYEGDFNGNGKTIKNLSITCNDSHMWAGIFGVISGDIYNFKLDNVDVVNNSQSSGSDSAQAASGTAAGAIRNGGSILDVTALNTCSVEGYYRTGGIVGSCRDRNAEVTNCINYATVEGNANYTGGIVGAAHNFFSIFSDFGTYVSGCENHGDVTGTTEVGGIVGYTDRASVSGCLNKGTVTATGNYGAGGIVGCDIYNPQSLFTPTMGSTISNSTNEGAVTAPRAGSILGSYVVAPGDSQPGTARYSTISSCTNTGAISSPNGTGKCGAIYGAPISYAQGDNPGNLGNMKVRIQNCQVGGSAEGEALTAENYSTHIAASDIVEQSGNTFYAVTN